MAHLIIIVFKCCIGLISEASLVTFVCVRMNRLYNTLCGFFKMSRSEENFHIFFFGINQKENIKFGKSHQFTGFIYSIFSTLFFTHKVRPHLLYSSQNE